MLFAAAAITLIAAPSLAQNAGDGFLFHPPPSTWTFRAGVVNPTANSDVFTFVTDQLTLDRSDFRSPTFGVSLAIRTSPRNDVVIDAGYSNVVHSSEFRDWVDQNDRPIEQTTALHRIPITLGLRHYITSRGRAIGQFAWIPARRALYVAAGAGLMRYKFRQTGDFIDFATLNVFSDEYVSEAWTPVAHAAAGLDIALGKFTKLNTEARYTWAHATMSADFVGFDRIDLSGVSLTTGLTFSLF